MKKILIVDDSVLLRNILKELFKQVDDFEVIGEASNGEMAIALTKEFKPDLIIMDVSMPIMNGIDATKIIMEKYPTPVFIFSYEANASLCFDALQLGAVDVLKKPNIDEFNDKHFVNNFLSLLRQATKTPIKEPTEKNKIIDDNMSIIKEFQIVVIGSSTGGPKALSLLLSRLPKDFSLGIVITQHLETGFDKGFADWLDKQTELNVRLAKDNDFPNPSEVLIAPNDKHLIFREKKLFLDDGEKVLNQKPSVDVLFRSAANNFGNTVIGVLLTGMGRDGAMGALSIKERGGYTIIQDRDSCTIFGMPKAAIELKADSIVLSLDEIPNQLLKLTGHTKL